MNFLDWMLLILVAAYALSGYWQGFIAGALATIGLVLGGFFGVWLAPTLLGSAPDKLWVSLLAVLIVILCATLGQALFQYAGSRLREQVSWQPARFVDAAGGAVLGATAVLIVAWVLGVAIAGTRLPGVTPVVRDSLVLGKIDDTLPDGASKSLDRFNEVVGSSFFPRYLDPFTPERIVEVGPGPKRLLQDPDITRTDDTIVKILGRNSCNRGIEGTGFLYSGDRVMTNAHVVAGVKKPVVNIGGEEVVGEVVVYEPQLDVAVIQVDDQGIAPMKFIKGIKQGAGVAIVGYPNDGPFTIRTGRIRAEQRLRSPDIYGNGEVIRDVYSVRGLIQPGNSGGPILNSRGRVAGVIFAASVTDKNTGYALTKDQVSATAAKGVNSTSAVSTGRCAN